jgi:hypothetical protein
MKIIKKDRVYGIQLTGPVWHIVYVLAN